VHGAITRREFLDRASKYCVGGVTAAAVLEMLTPNFAWAQQVKKDDPRIKAEYADYDSPQGSGQDARLSRAAGQGGEGARRSRHPREPGPESRTSRMSPVVSRPKATSRFAPGCRSPRSAAIRATRTRRAKRSRKLDANKRTEGSPRRRHYLKSRPECSGKWGRDRILLRRGCREHDRHADARTSAQGVPFYGAQPNAEDVPKIKAAMQMHYAGEDERINAGHSRLRGGTQGGRGEVRDSRVSEGTQHGFHNDTTPRYDEAAAKLSWSRSLAWFKQYLA
jgi:carboxymethylenebutenolidase